MESETEESAAEEYDNTPSQSPAKPARRKYTKKKKPAVASRVTTPSKPEYTDDSTTNKAQIAQQAAALSTAQQKAAALLIRQRQEAQEEAEMERAIAASLLNSQNSANEVRATLEQREEAGDQDLDRIMNETLIEARDAEEAPVDHSPELIAEVYSSLFILDVKEDIYPVPA
jgi:erythromycin esterase-like protein